jgi:hypothetical protein
LSAPVASWLSIKDPVSDGVAGNIQIVALGRKVVTDGYVVVVT